MLWRLIQALWRGRGTPAGTHVTVANSPRNWGHFSSVEDWLQTGTKLQAEGELAAALDCFRACAAAYPEDLPTRAAVASALAAAWRMDECIETCADALSAWPRHPEVFSSYLLYSHYAARPCLRAIFELHRRYGDMIAVAQPPHFTTRSDRADPDRPLRVGYVSRDFRLHSVAYFIEPVIAHHDRARYRIYCYYLSGDHDDTTQRISQSADVWREAHGDSDDALAARIYEDEIDILVDLGGHTKLNRLGVFAQKPAPVQATWLGYPDTTGLATIDWRITDTVADPPGLADEIHTERLLRLEPPFVCYQPLRESPSVDPRDAPREVVFGSFNMLIKLNEPLIDIWAQILKAVPDSRLIIKSGLLEHDETVWRVHERFAHAGIAPSRVDLRALTQSSMDHLAAYNEVDVALDTFPYNGTTTTCEALWMGVPVVTLAGEGHMSRVGASLLTAAGLSNLISASPEEYVRTAVTLARDPALRRALRVGMRDRLAASALFDYAGFTRKLEGALRQAWRAWCESSHTQGPASRADMTKARTEL